jgi:hypothetical protein
VTEHRDIATDVVPTADAAARRWSSLAYALRALGRAEPPKALVVGDVTYTRTKVIKHDFFAATAFYASPVGGAVLKVGRTEPFLALPLVFIGRFLCRRELGFYRRCKDLPNVPAVVATWGETGFLHAFVEGAPLDQRPGVSDAFFDELQQLLRTLHARGIAYVDTNKPQNILHGDDGRPHLIDFQISFDAHTFANLWPARWLLGVLARSDEYHILKHKRRYRPDLLSDAERERLERKNWAVRTHRFVTKPYFLVRRRLMGHLRKKGQIMPEGSK